MFALATLLLGAKLFAAESLEFRASEKALFVVREPTLSATNGIPVFRAIIDNRAGEDWESVYVSVSVEIACPDGKSKSLAFTAGLGRLAAGDNNVSDSIVSAKGALEACSAVIFSSIQFNSGQSLAARVSTERARQTASAFERDIAFARATGLGRPAESPQVRKTCGQLFDLTATKKVSDLTVIEDQQIKVCQALGLYSPQ
jgi:hypothetical protein